MKRTLPARCIVLLAAASVAFAGACSDSSSTSPPASGDITKINHVVVIYLENHSFDNLYGEFAGAEGLADGRGAPRSR